MTTLHLRKSVDWSPLRLGVLLIALALATLAKRMAFPLLLLTAGLVFVHPCTGQSGTWAPTGSLNIARGSHTATLLSNGKVLVAGGYGFSGILASAELYDPETGIWVVNRQPPHRTLLSHGDLAAQRHGARCRRLWYRQQ